MKRVFWQAKIGVISNKPIAAIIAIECSSNPNFCKISEYINTDASFLFLMDGSISSSVRYSGVLVLISLCLLTLLRYYYQLRPLWACRKISLVQITTLYDGGNHSKVKFNCCRQHWLLLSIYQIIFVTVYPTIFA